MIDDVWRGKHILLLKVGGSIPPQERPLFFFWYEWFFLFGFTCSVNFL